MELIKKVIAAVLSLFSVAAGANGVANLNPHEFEARLKEKEVVVLDVRTPEEFSTGHIKGAVNIDFLASDFNQKLTNLDKNKSYLVYCASGGRSAAACKLMMKLGFLKCYNLQGGITGWKRAGKPVEKSTR